MLRRLNLIIALLFLITGTAGVAGNNTPTDNSNLTAEVKMQQFEDRLHQLYDEIKLEDYNLSYDIFRHAMVGYFNLKNNHKLSEKKIITIIDFSKSSREERFYTIDLVNKKVIYHTLVAHGAKTGDDIARYFSNKVNSNQSSLGFYVTGETYTGSKGFSLRLDGMDYGYNDKMRERAVVIHAADYVSEETARQLGRLGRSWGCPALPRELNAEIINTIKEKTMIFAYYDDAKYLASSKYLNQQKAIDLALKG